MPSLATSDLKICPKSPNAPCCSRIRIVSKGCPAQDGREDVSSALMACRYSANKELLMVCTGQDASTSTNSAC